jgi:histone H4
MSKQVGKRHVTRPKRPGLSKPDIRRLARRAGVVRISGTIYDTTRDVLKKFVTKILHDCMVMTEHSKRSTVTARDVVYALKRHGHSLYGYGALQTFYVRKRKTNSSSSAVSSTSTSVDFLPPTEGYPSPTKESHMSASSPAPKTPLMSNTSLNSLATVASSTANVSNKKDGRDADEYATPEAFRKRLVTEFKHRSPLPFAEVRQYGGFQSSILDQLEKAGKIMMDREGAQIFRSY